MVCAKQMASLTDTQEGCNSVLSLWEDLLNLYFIFLLFPFHFVIQQGPSGVCMTSKRGHNKLTNIQSSEQNFNFNLTSSKCSPNKSLLLKKFLYFSFKFPFGCCQSVRVGSGSPLHLPVSRLLAA